MDVCHSDSSHKSENSSENQVEKESKRKKLFKRALLSVYNNKNQWQYKEDVKLQINVSIT